MLNFRKTGEARVLYINNPDGLIKDSTLYLTKELIYTIAKDVPIWCENPQDFILECKSGVDPKQTLLEYLSSLLIKSDVTKFINLLEKYRDYCCNKKIPLYLFIDQYTQFQRINAYFPQICAQIHSLFEYFNIVLYGVSEAADIARSNQPPEIILDGKFSVDQAVMYLSKKIANLEVLKLPKEMLNEGVKVENEEELTEEERDLIERYNKVAEEQQEEKRLIKDEIIQKEIERAMYKKYPNLQRLKNSTEFSPYELEVFSRVANQNIRKTFPEVFETFYRTRFNEIYAIHENWARRFYNDEALRNATLVPFLIKMSLGITGEYKLSHLLYKPDPNLFYTDNKVYPPVVRFNSKVVEAALNKKISVLLPLKRIFRKN